MKTKRTERTHCIPVLPYPVTKTGTYFNAAANTYDFFFVLNKHVAQVGACGASQPVPLIKLWRAYTLEGLRKLVAMRIEDGTLSVNPLLRVEGFGDPVPGIPGVLDQNTKQQ